MGVTIKDLARETGLTAATISAYFNGGNVRAYNREKIERAIEKLGYVRNDYARALRTHRSMTVGVLIPEMSNLFSTTIIAEMEEDLRRKGYGVIVCDCRSDRKREQEAMRFLLSKMVDGMIVIPVTTESKTFAAALEKGVPCVAIDRLTDNKKVSHVLINNRSISAEAVKKMIDEGIEDVAIVCGDESVYTAKERLAGYMDAMKAAGLEDRALSECGHLTIEGGYNAVKKILSEHPHVKGIFVTNYEMTVGGIIALNEEGVKAGQDVAFIGFDNVEILKSLYPGMHTVGQPIKEIGRVAADTLISMMDGGPARNSILEATIE